MQTLIDFIYSLFNNFLSYLLCPVKWLYSNLSQLIIDSISSIDVSTLSSLSNAYLITSELAYYLDLFAFKESFAILASAYTVRFIIRRIPVVG